MTYVKHKQSCFVVFTAFGISMISYNGTMRLGLGVDKCILTTQPQAQELLNFIRDEIYILGQDAVV
jgi:hypothetical protein